MECVFNTVLTEFLKNFMTISNQKFFATVVCFSIHVVVGMERQNSKTRQRKLLIVTFSYK